jgi:hypothetical protein
LVEDKVEVIASSRCHKVSDFVANEASTNLCHRYNKRDGPMHLELLQGSVLAPSRDNRKKNKVLKLELLYV